MKCSFRHLTALLLVFLKVGLYQNFATAAILPDDDPDELCQDVLSWIYKDLTVKNLEKSIERTKKKLVAGIIVTLKNNQLKSLDSQPQLAELWLSMNKLDPNFEKYLKKNKPYRKFMDYNFFDRIFGRANPNETEIHNFFNLIKMWKDLQKNQPQYFKGLDDNLKLDDWDLATSDIVDKVGTLTYENSTVLNNIRKISQDLKSFAPNPQKIFQGKNKSLKKISSDIDNIQESILESIVEVFTNNFDEYKDYCSQEDFFKMLNDSISAEFCPIEMPSTTPSLSIRKNLRLIANVLKKHDLNSTFRPEKPILVPEVTTPDPTVSNVNTLCPVKIDYSRVKKSSKYTTFNTRGSDLVDTIIIHHTGDETNLSTDAELIHKTHVNKWHMVAYNYFISFGGNGATIDKPRIIQGRDPSYQGAHAGGQTLPLAPSILNKFIDQSQEFNCREVLDEEQSMTSKVNTKTICEETTDELPSLAKKKALKCASNSSIIADIDSDGTANGNLTSIGIALLGNFATEHRTTFFGEDLYASKKVHISKVKDQAIEKLVSLINALKADYPNLKKIVPHSYYRPTRCPGSVKEIMSEVANQTSLEFFSNKDEEFDKYKTTRFKHLRKSGNNYVYKNKYANFLDIMNEIHTQEEIIVYIKKIRMLWNKSDSYREGEVKRAQDKLILLRAKRDALNIEDLI